MKRIALLLVAVLMAVGVLQAQSCDFAVRAASGQMLHYKVQPDGASVLLVAPRTEWPYYAEDEKPVGEVVVPGTVNHDGHAYAVRGVGECAFYRCEDLTALVLPEGCERLGAQSLCGCVALQRLELPNTLCQISDGALAYCTALCVLRLPPAVVYIGTSAFACTGLCEVQMSGGQLRLCNALTFTGSPVDEEAKKAKNAPPNEVFLKCDPVKDGKILR